MCDSVGDISPWRSSVWVKRIDRYGTPQAQKTQCDLPSVFASRDKVKSNYPGADRVIMREVGTDSRCDKSTNRK